MAGTRKTTRGRQTEKERERERGWQEGGHDSSNESFGVIDFQFHETSLNWDRQAIFSQGRNGKVPKEGGTEERPFAGEKKRFCEGQ